MTAPLPDLFGKHNRRKESRYKTSAEQLHCRTSVDEPGRDQICEGTTIDISPSGMRLLTKGDFQVGQPMWTELLTTRSHGVYRGNVRRIEPWVGGQVILGCSLRDIIPREVLQDLASDGVINRRSDGRFCISQPAKVAWPLSAEEIDVELLDYSSGGMKVQSLERLPENTRLRVRFESNGREISIEAKSVWDRETETGCVTGIAFSDRNASAIVAATLGADETDETSSDRKPVPGKARQVMTVTVCLLLFGYVLFTAM